MHFTSPVHWAEGLFLQPQHLQRFQQNVAHDSYALFALQQPYPYGVIELELNEDALLEQRVEVRKLKAVLSDGTLLDVPHNASVPPLTVTTDLTSKLNAPTIEICLCVPLLSTQHSNVCTKEKNQGRYELSLEEVGDENRDQGLSEVTLVMRRYHAFLCERSQVPDQALALPLIQLNWSSTEQGQLSLSLNQHYMPPYLTVSATCPLLHLGQELLLTLRQQQLQLQHQLSERALENQVFTAAEVIKLQVLATLTGFVAKAQCFLQPQLITPFAFYLELVELLSQLSILRPQVNLQLKPYEHDNALPCCEQVVRLIRLFLHEESNTECQIFDFEPHTPNTQILRLTQTAPLESNEIYLALHVDLPNTSAAGTSAAGTSSAGTGAAGTSAAGTGAAGTSAAGTGAAGTGGTGLTLLQIAQTIESGDKFRLLDPASYNERIRGVKLSYLRYPPQYLPQSNFNLLFRVKTDESVRVWHYIMSDKALLLDYAPELWGPIKAQLIVVSPTH